MFRIVFTYSILLMFSTLCFAQDLDPNAYNVFYHPNGSISSEGNMRDGKPDGFWKSYYETGVLKSEGNRKEFQLDSTWNFYYPNGKLKNKIRYRNDKKNGYTISYLKNKNNTDTTQYYQASKELYINGLRQGESYYYSKEGYTQYSIYFQNDKKHGKGLEYNKDSTIITLLEYFNGYLIEQTKINRKDALNKKQGKWISYYNNGQISIECSYRNDKLHGYYRNFDKYGKLKLEKRYLNGEEVTREIEQEIEVKADVRTTYWPNGKTKYIGAFLENSPIGLHKEFNSEGIIENVKVFSEFGILTAEGLLNQSGNRTGDWTIYYEDGAKLAFGKYNDNKKQGNWQYFYNSGETEQVGEYVEGKPDGTWYWYYPDEKLLREENFINGKKEGLFAEYDSKGEVITKGEYYDGDRSGEWYYNVGDHSEIGSYSLGLKTGKWIHYYDNGKVSFEGEYRNNDPINKHNFYYYNGNLSLSGKYKAGKKYNKWKKYNQDGSLFTTYKYRTGKLVAIDGKKLEEEDIIEE